MATYSNSIIVSGNIAGGYTVPANQYVIVDFSYTSGVTANVRGILLLPITRYYGPGQVVPNTLSITVQDDVGTGVTLTYNADSGVIFRNA